MAVATFEKDPEANLDYAIDWSNWLKEDIIIDSHWTADEGISLGSDSHTDTVSTVWVFGGSNRKRYELTNTVITAGGRIDERTIRIKCRQK